MKARAVSGMAALAVAACLVPLAFTPKPLVVWNMTASAPIGLYRRSATPVQIGDWVLLQPSDKVASLAAQRGYLPQNVPMVKLVAAADGDTVCRQDHVVSINGRVRAVALTRDKAGRRLPVWQGCTQLQDGKIFVLTEPPDSFDGRYFGAVPRTQVIERIEPLWTF